MRARSPIGEPLAARELQALRAALGSRPPRQLGVEWSVSKTAVTRAAAGLRLLAGTRRLIADGIERLRVSGALPSGCEEGGSR
jgi:hypothetical protein